MAILNEVYVGRLPEIDQMVTDIHNFRREYKLKGNISILNTAKILEKHIEDMWGFKAVSIDIIISSYPNAETWCAGSCIDCDLKDVIQFTNKGYRFVKESNVSCTTKVTTGLLSDESISDEEILAVLLHEIGHSFVERSKKINQIMEQSRKATIMYLIKKLITDIFTFHPFKSIEDIKYLITLSSSFNKYLDVTLTRFMKNVPILRHIHMSFKELKNTIIEQLSDWITNQCRNNPDIYNDKNYKSLDKTRKKNEEKVKNNKLDDNTAFLRSLERLADDFAAMYGMGVYLSSALLKMGRPYSYGGLSKSDPTNIQKKIDDAAIELVMAIADHPGNCDRLLAMIDGLEKDYKSLKIDSKIKAELKKDIDGLKKITNDLKKSEGIIKEYNNKYMEKSAKDNIKKGNTETKKEKIYNDRKQINKDWEKNKIDID